MDKLDGDQILALERAIAGGTFSSSLFPPLARIIMDAVGAQVTPRVTVMQGGNPPVLTLDYPSRSISLVAEPSTQRLEICLVLRTENRLIRRWTVFTNAYRTELIIISVDPSRPVHNGATWINYSLSAEIVGDLARPGLPDLITDIVFTLQPPPPPRREPPPAPQPLRQHRQPQARQPETPRPSKPWTDWRRWLQPF